MKSSAAHGLLSPPVHRVGKFCAEIRAGRGIEPDEFWRAIDEPPRAKRAHGEGMNAA